MGINEDFVTPSKVQSHLFFLPILLTMLANRNESLSVLVFVE